MKHHSQHRKHLVVVDPTAFSGGSKVATESILQLLDDKKIRVSVLTADKHSWQNDNIDRVHLSEPKWLAQKEQGIGYFIRHAYIAIHLLLIRLRFGSFDLALGASGPGVDLALYMLRPFMNFNIIQLIHGPVAKSRTIARCLNVAQQVFYLPSSYDSLQNALSTLTESKQNLPANFQLLKNGLSDNNWPSACQKDKAIIFWAASLLKWKGLDTLLNALKEVPTKQRPITRICYIKPHGVQLPLSHAPISVTNIEWFESPTNLDTIRASANIFVSTSKNEPFGLSILEAMAAGQCVLIPADGAYWDRILTDKVNCIKYQPDNYQDLQQKLLQISNNLALTSQLGEQAALLALNYRASQQYKNVIESISSSILANHKHSLVGTLQ